MDKFILLTPGEADTVRDSISATKPHYVPIRRGNDPVEMYILPVSILDRPEHEQWKSFLGALPQLDREDPDLPPPWEG